MILSYPDRKTAIATSRNEAYSVPISDNRLLCRVLGKFKMFVDSRDMSQMPSLIMDGIHEPRITELLCDTVKQGMVCCEIGAAFGYSALIMSEIVGPKGSVHAFEPNSTVFRLLKQNVAIEFSNRVSISQEAIGDTVGPVQIAMHRQRFAGATLNPAMKSSYGANCDLKDVQMTTLDERMLNRGVVPDFYMISCCGYEHQVLRGMQGCLREKRKVSAIVEAFPKFQADPKMFASELLDQGFIVHQVADEHLTPLTDPEQIVGKFRCWLLLSR